MNRLPSSAGIAIGPILFVLAMLGVLATVFASGSGGSLGTASIADRITNDIGTQVNLIRSKISECEMQFHVNGDNYASASGDCPGDRFPCSDQTDGTPVANLTCPNDPLDGTDERSLWTGLRVASFPPPTKGFNAWTYFNAGETGGRCFWTTPVGGKDGPTVDGLTRAASKFTSQEVSYDPTSNSQKFVIFVTRPSGATNSHCTVP